MSRHLLAAVLAFGFSAAVVPLPAPAQGLPDFTELVEKVGPAVVSVRTAQRVRASRPGDGELDPEMLEFFRRFGMPVPKRQAPTPQGSDGETQPRGVGSGFILNADGYVLTNAHVIEGADEVTVTLLDKREFKARTIGADKRSDVALLKIDATALPTVRIGDVARLKVGEWVIAIGSPFNLENTVTAGIVSAKARETGDALPSIQTDVPINPGNSGGPLINMRGEVVGINSQIYSGSGGYMGVSFAIPIDEATRVSEQLRTVGRVVRSKIGVVIAPVTRDVAESIGLGKPAGALVRSVEAGDPADKAGIEPGDIITRVDGRIVDSSIDLPRFVSIARPGATLKLQVFRNARYRDLSVQTVELEPERVAALGAPPADVAKPVAPVGTLGLAVAELSDLKKRELKLKSGVRVVAAEGPAARAGLREDDVIVAVDSTEVGDVRQFDAAVAKLGKTKAITVLVRRGPVANYLIVRPPI